MTTGALTTILQGAIWETLVLAAPLLLVALVVGLVIAILQAATSIQEQTLTFVPKIFAILLTLAFLGGWMSTRLANYTIQLFELIPLMAQ